MPKPHINIHDATEFTRDRLRATVERAAEIGIGVAKLDGVAGIEIETDTTVTTTDGGPAEKWRLTFRVQRIADR